MDLPRLNVEYGSRGRVVLEASFELPIEAADVWLEIRDFERYACQDLFHRRALFAEGSARAGARFLLEHRLAGIRLWRAGRILRWSPGRGYAFSDLSRRDPQRGFPHIYEYDITPLETETSLFRLRVTGRWSAHFLPSPLIRLWLGAILLKTAVSIRNSLLRAECQRLELQSRRFSVS